MQTKERDSNMELLRIISTNLSLQLNHDTENYPLLLVRQGTDAPVPEKVHRRVEETDA